MLYFNVLFRQLILNIDCDMMMNYLDSNYENFYFCYQNLFIVKELQRNIDEMYLGGGNTIVSNDVFIMTNIRIDHQMDAE